MAKIPLMVPDGVPQILINRESLLSHTFNVELLGRCDTIVAELAARLQWSLQTPQETSLISDLISMPPG